MRFSTLFTGPALGALMFLATFTALPAQAAGDAPLVVAHKMINAWNARDVDAIAELFAEDGRFLSMTAPPAVKMGREVIRREWGALLSGVSDIELQLRHITVQGDSVFIERVDVFTYRGKLGRVPVACVLDIKDGKVQEWREYYDRASLLAEMGVDQIDE